MRRRRFVAEGAPDAQGTRDEVGLGVLRLVLCGVADDPRVAVLAEQEPRTCGEVGDEDRPGKLGLGLVDVAAGDRRDRRLLRQRLGERPLGARVLLQQGDDHRSSCGAKTSFANSRSTATSRRFVSRALSGSSVPSASRALPA